MVRKLTLAVTTLALLAAAPAAHAQAAGDRHQFGLGIGANASFGDTIGAFPFELYFPIRIAPQVKIEPSLGFQTGDSDTTDFSEFMLGVGVFAVKRVSAPVDLYYGGRLKLDFVSRDNGPGTNVDGTDFYLAGAAGGEYFVVPQFSLGLEANLGYYSLGDASGNQDGFYTTGLFLMRMYF